MARRYYSSTAARTTLASGVDNSTTTLSVVAVSGWPASYPYTLVIDQDTVNEELVSVTNRSGTTLTVTRGIDGTSAVAHDAGAAVNHGVSAQDFDEPNAFINGTGVVTSTMIENGTIVNDDINASAAIAQSKISNLTSDLASKLDDTDATWSNWTPVVTQSSTITHTVSYARYVQLNKLVILVARLSMTGTGSAGNRIVITGLPVAPSGGGDYSQRGSFTYADIGTANYVGSCSSDSTGGLIFAAHNTQDWLGAPTGPSFAIASGDVLTFTAIYEVA